MENSHKQKQLFMIMCHKNVKQVLRLAEKCITEESDVIIHADSYMADAEFALLEDASHKNSQLYLAKNRLHGELDKRSLIDIAIEMIRSASEIEQYKDVHYRYYCLMSGQDYPLKPLSYINEELRKSYPEPYIDCSAYNKKKWMYKKFRWSPFTNKFRVKVDNLFQKNKRNPIRVAAVAALLVLTKLTHFIQPSYYHLLKKKGVGVYAGSAWWILPDKAISYIGKEYEKGGQIVEWILQSITPEESFFQIMAMRSPIADMIQMKPDGSSAQRYKTWSYFFDDDKPPVAHPYTFTIKQYDKLIRSDKWFARKFDINEDVEIMNRLDAYCEEWETNAAVHR